MPPFDRAHTTSYSTLIETVSIFYHFQDIAGYLSKAAIPKRTSENNLVKLIFTGLMLHSCPTKSTKTLK